MKTKILNVLFLCFLLSSFQLLAQSTNSDSKLIVSVSGKSSGEITLGELAGQPLLVNNDSYKVISFTFEVTTTETSSVSVEGMFINKQASGKVRTAPTGTIVRITDIKVANEQNNVVQVSDLIFTLKK